MILIISLSLNFQFEPFVPLNFGDYEPMKTILLSITVIISNEGREIMAFHREILFRLKSVYY